MSKYEILETTDYGMFKPLLGNRDRKSESKIIDSIQRVGYIISPLIVNEKMEVIDGQNRLAALESLGLPVHYIVEPGLGIEACRQLNIGQTNWTTEDYVYSYAEIGDPNYRRLASLLMEFKKPLGVNGIIAMAKPLTINDSGSSARLNINKGKFELSQNGYHTAIKRISSALEFGYGDFQKQNKMNNRIYWGAVSYIYQHKVISAGECIKAMNKYQAIIPACFRVSEQLSYIDEAYNKDIRKASDKISLASDFQKRMYLDEEDEINYEDR